MTSKIRHFAPTKDQRLPLELIHIFRGILRASTYTRDPWVRDYIRNLATSRLRAGRWVFTTTTGPGSAAGGFIDARATAHFGTARQQMTFLQRATMLNEPRAFRRLLFLAYGRQGRRRRMLLDELLRSESTLPANDESLQILAADALSTERKFRTFEPTPELLALLRSQQINVPTELHMPKIRSIRPRIPPENAWGRPMPLIRQHSIAQKFWATTLSRVLPPLPPLEFDRLVGLSSGRVLIPPPIPRRSRARASSSAPEQTALSHRPLTTIIGPSTFEQNVKTIRDNAQREANGSWALGPQYPPLENRAMRRLYGIIAAISSIMVKEDPAGQKDAISFRWGNSPPNAASNPFGTFTKPTKHDAELFQGLNGEPAPVNTRTIKGKRQPVKLAVEPA